jgi:hypothetical protein
VCLLRGTVQVVLVFRLPETHFQNLDRVTSGLYYQAGRTQCNSVLCSLDCRRAVSQTQQQGTATAGMSGGSVTPQDLPPDTTPGRSPSGHQGKDLNDCVSDVEFRRGVEWDGGMVLGCCSDAEGAAPVGRLAVGRTAVCSSELVTPRGRS